MDGGSTFVLLKSTYDAEWVTFVLRIYESTEDLQIYMRDVNLYDYNTYNAEWVNVYKCLDTLMVYSDYKWYSMYSTYAAYGMVVHICCV